MELREIAFRFILALLLSLSFITFARPTDGPGAKCLFSFDTASARANSTGRIAAKFTRVSGTMQTCNLGISCPDNYGVDGVTGAPPPTTAAEIASQLSLNIASCGSGSTLLVSSVVGGTACCVYAGQGTSSVTQWSITCYNCSTMYPMGLNLSCVGSGLVCTPGSCGFPIVKADQKVFPLTVDGVSLEFRGAPYLSMNLPEPMTASIRFIASSAAGIGGLAVVPIAPFNDEDEDTALTAVAQAVVDFVAANPGLGYTAQLGDPTVRVMDDEKKSAFVDILTVQGVGPPVRVDFLLYDYDEDVSEVAEDERGRLGYGVWFNGALDPPPYQLPGDFDRNGMLQLTDVINLLNYLFNGTVSELPCEVGLLDAPGNLGVLDSNGDGEVDISDIVYVLNYLFRDGPPHILGIDCYPFPGCPDNWDQCLEAQQG